MADTDIPPGTDSQVLKKFVAENLVSGALDAKALKREEDMRQFARMMQAGANGVSMSGSDAANAARRANPKPMPYETMTPDQQLAWAEFVMEDDAAAERIAAIKSKKDVAAEYQKVLGHLTGLLGSLTSSAAGLDTAKLQALSKQLEIQAQKFLVDADTEGTGGVAGQAKLTPALQSIAGSGDLFGVNGVVSIDGAIEELLKASPGSGTTSAFLDEYARLNPRAVVNGQEVELKNGQNVLDALMQASLTTTAPDGSTIGVIPKESLEVLNKGYFEDVAAVKDKTLQNDENAAKLMQTTQELDAYTKKVPWLNEYIDTIMGRILDLSEDPVDVAKEGLVESRADIEGLGFGLVPGANSEKRKEDLLFRIRDKSLVIPETYEDAKQKVMASPDFANYLKASGITEDKADGAFEVMMQSAQRLYNMRRKAGLIEGRADKAQAKGKDKLAAYREARADKVDKKKVDPVEDQFRVAEEYQSPILGKRTRKKADGTTDEEYDPLAEEKAKDALKRMAEGMGAAAAPPPTLPLESAAGEISVPDAAMQIDTEQQADARKKYLRQMLGKPFEAEQEKEQVV